MPAKLSHLSAMPWVIALACSSAAGWTATSYPMSYTSCGVTHTLQESPSRVVTMNQGVTEFMLAMGLEDKMAGTAYIDDVIWPKYADAYASIPVLSSGYANETQIMDISADFVLGSFRSAFREKECADCRGIFSSATVGPCEGNGSEWSSSSYNTCRPQLHANAIGTWLEPASCEDPALRPQGGASEETVYSAIRQIGEIFNVQERAEQLVAEITADFDMAEYILEKRFEGHLNVVWLDCIECCKVDGVPSGQLFVGSGSGAPNLIMKEAGMTNVFANMTGNGWVCVNASEIIAADPDLVVVVDAAWDTALEKIEYMYNHTEFCNARFVQKADFITIPFSASSLGPRNGAAALDMGSAAIHVITGAPKWDYKVKSGVAFLDPQQLADDTANLLCPLNIGNVAYTAPPPPPTAPPPPSSPPPPPPPPPPPLSPGVDASGSSDSDDVLPIALGVTFGVLFLLSVAFAVMMGIRERQGKPFFKQIIVVDESGKSANKI